MYATLDERLTVLDLHLFDAQTNVTTDNDLSVEMKTYYHDRLIDYAEPKLVHDQFGQKVPIPRNKGKSVEFRKYSPLPKATTALQEGVTPKGRKLKVTNLLSEIKQYGDYVELSDVLEMTAIDRNVEQATKLLGGQSGRTLDTITREVLAGGTNKMFVPKKNADNSTTEVLLRENVEADTCELTLDAIQVGVGKLKRMNAEPVDEDFVAIVHPDTTTDIKRDRENWIEIHKYANPENIYSGEVGKYGGVRFVETTEAKIIGPGWLFGSAEEGGVCRMRLKTALDSTGSTDIVPEEGITAAQAAELTARIAGGETVRMYVGGKEATIASVTAGAGGAAKITVTAAVKDVAAGAMICGYGAGKDGSAIYCTLLVGANAYGVTDVEGMGLQHIIKQLGSAGTADPLNQRSTTGWKATKTAERLVEEYMLRIEHSSRTFGKSAVSN